MVLTQKWSLSIALGIVSFICFSSKAVITSLASFKKDGREVCVIGVRSLNKGEDAQDTKVFSEFLEGWSKLPQEICFPLNVSIDLAQEGDWGRNNIVECLANIAYQSETGRYGSMAFKYQSDLGPSSQLNQFITSFMATYFGDSKVFRAMAKKHNFPKDSILALDAFFEKSKKLKNEFFSPKGSYASFEKELLGGFVELPYTFNEYLKGVEQLLYSGLNTLKNVQGGVKPLLNLLIQLGLQRKKLEKFVDFYSHNNRNASVVEVMLNLVKSKQSFSEGAKEYYETVLSLITNCDTLKYLFSVYFLLVDKDAERFLCVVDHETAVHLYAFLNALGFKKRGTDIKSLGYKLTVGNGRVLNEGSSQNWIPEFLTTVFSDKDVSSTSLLPTEPHSVLALYDVTAKSILGAYDISVRKYQCVCCHIQLEPYMVYLFNKENKAYCSEICLITKLLECNKDELLGSLVSHASCTEEDRLALEKLALICYYQFLITLPTSSTDCGLFSKLPHKHILRSLKAIEESMKDATPEGLPWKRALILGKILGEASLEQITIFFKTFIELKDTYLRELIKNYSKKSYEYLSEAFEDSTLDKKGKLQKIQDLRAMLFARAFNCSTPKQEAVSRFYNDLYMLLIQKLGHIRTLEELTKLQEEKSETNPYLGMYEIEQLFPVAPSKPKVIKQRDSVSSYKKEEDEVKESKSSTSLITPTFTIKEEEIKEFIEPSRVPQAFITKSLRGHLVGKESYTITLYNTKDFLNPTEELEEAYSSWKSCPLWKESSRVKLLFALHDNLEEQENASCKEGASGVPTLAHSTLAQYDPTITEKLDLHHLFSRQVDTYLTKLGITERLDDCIQVSIPGEIIYKNGTRVIGFFQYTFNKQWFCIHRCFKPYDSNLKENTHYISPLLRSTLYAFLKCHMSDKMEYLATIQDLEDIISQRA